MAKESQQKKISRVRTPRVHIEYEVFTDGAMEKRDLPFVVGVMGDFSGNPTEELPDLVDRSFVEIDRDNFDAVMARMKPGLNLRVKNTVAGDDSEIPVQLKFSSLADMEPAAVAEQVPAIKKLLETRNQLRDLLTKIDRDRGLEKILEQIGDDEGKLQALAKELGIGEESSGDDDSSGSEGGEE